MDPLNSMARYCGRILMLGLLLSSLSWVPQVYHSFMLFFSVSLPNIISVAVARKSLFFVSNIIVIFLFGESKLGKCTKKNEHECMTVGEKVEYFGLEKKMFSYENLREMNVGIIQENKEVEAVAAIEEKNIVEIVAKREEIGAPEDGDIRERDCEEMERKWDEDKMENEHEELEREKEEMEMRDGEDNIESEHEEIEMRDGESEDEETEREEDEMERWAAEELNRKVEDFIAKVNMQIRLEARMAISCY
jgi:Cotton fibre expressed protein/Domain of unknown function (DUF4408)